MKVRQWISPKLIFGLRPFTFSIAETLHYNLLQLTKDLISYSYSYSYSILSYRHFIAGYKLINEFFIRLCNPREKGDL